MLLQLMKGSMAYILAVTLIVCSLLLNGLFGFLTQFREPNTAESLVSQLQQNQPPYPGDSFDNIWWFVQVTDLHISDHVRPQIVPDLIAWCEQMHEIIKPEFILVTGDLTDAKARDQIRSHQIESEWKRYKHVRDACHEKIALKDKAAQPEPWIDIRGNHDSFDVDLKKEEPFKVDKFLATKYNSVTHFSIVKPFGQYLFIGIDFSPQPGPARPLNFFGFYNATRDDPKLTALINSGQNSNMTFLYGHHTLNVVTSAENFFARMRYGSVYLCGHLHALLEWKSTQHLYGYHHDASLLELELADFQNNRRFRVVALDHDLMSFADVSVGQWPVIVITCPKHAQYTVPGKEPIGKMKFSSHIRLLVFSITVINRVHVEIARETNPHNPFWRGEAVNTYGPLYTLDWKPKSFSEGLFIIRVIATDDFGNQRTVVQPFSMDGSAPSLPPVASFIIASNLTKGAKVLFWTAHACFITCLLLLRFRLALMRRMNVFRVPFLGYLLENLTLYTSFDQLFKPLVFWQLWAAYGPWFFGRLLSDKWAFVFVNGVFFLDGTFLPSGLNYIFGLFHLVMFDLPMVFIVSSILRTSTKNGDSAAFSKLSRRKPSIADVMKRRMLLFIALILLIWQSHKCFEVYLNYGLIAMMSNIIEFYCIFLYIYQLQFAMRYRI